MKLSQLAAVASGKQPKSLPNLIPEFAAIVPVHGVPLETAFAVSSKQQLKRCYAFISSTEPLHVHRSAKILRRTEKGVKSDATETDSVVGRRTFSFDAVPGLVDGFPGVNHQELELQHMPCSDCNTCSSACRSCEKVQLRQSGPFCDVVFGVPWDPIEFVHKACDIGHPQNIVLGLLSEVQVAVKKTATLSPEQIVFLRGQWFAKYVAEAKGLEVENRKMLLAMPSLISGGYAS